MGNVWGGWGEEREVDAWEILSRRTGHVGKVWGEWEKEREVGVWGTLKQENGGYGKGVGRMGLRKSTVGCY